MKKSVRCLNEPWRKLTMDDKVEDILELAGLQFDAQTEPGKLRSVKV